MVRLHHFLSIAVFFSLNLPGVRGAIFPPRSADYQLDGPVPKVTLEKTQLTNRRDGDSRLHHTLGLVKRLVEDHGGLVDVPTRAVYHLLDQIDSLRDQVLGMLPSSSPDESSTDQAKTLSLGGPTGQSPQDPASSNTVLGGAFKETSEDEPQGSSGDLGPPGGTQGSTEQTETQSQGSPGEPGPTNYPLNPTEQTEGELQEPSEKLETSNSDQDSTEEAEEDSQGSPQVTRTSSSPQGSTEQKEAQSQESSEEPESTNFTQDSIAQTEVPDPDGTGCDADPVSGLNSLHRDLNCATGSSAATDTMGQSPSMITSASTFGGLDQENQLSDTAIGAEGSPQTSTIASLIVSDGLEQGTQGPATVVGAEDSSQITTPALLTSPTNVEAVESTPEDSTGFLEIPQLITTVITSTNTSKSTVTLTTTRTKFLFLPQTSVGTPLGAGEGSAVNMTTTPGLSASDIAVATMANTPTNDDTTQTPGSAPQALSMRLPLRKVLISNSTADGTALSGFRTLSKPTRSVGEGNP
ncbi:hypothetical protein QQX98_010411 [Neonectria punicea]|uniref:Uncharacterized protein n=1 Tax=Neonectria punicea TaxID=979145 RepID=A0ABR1GPP3_9HYPO